MNNNYKEELSLHVEKIFKQYSNPGLYICDIATGGGKSYTIGKLTCEYYLQHFDRVIILCVQKKLIDGMNREVNKFINSPESLIKPEEKLVIENNQGRYQEGYQRRLF
jgi:superfamily II DNA or RNA helicase